MKHQFNIAIIEDVEDIRNNLKDYFEMRPEISSVYAYDSMEAFFSHNPLKGMPDIALCDIGLPGMNGIEGIKMIKNMAPETDIIMLTVFSDTEKIFQSLSAGATGYVLKNTPLPEIMKALLDIRAGGSYMTPSIARKVIDRFVPEKISFGEKLTTKEKHIVEALTDGLSYKLIAARLNISMDTVRFHIKNIYRKLHVNSKAEVIGKAYRGEL
jgi:DNA-binding NarL/FixJ family response regulator